MAYRILESNGNADFSLSVNASLLELGNNGAFTFFQIKRCSHFILVIILYVLLSGIVILSTVWLTETVPIKGGIRRNGVEQRTDETFLLEMILSIRTLLPINVNP